MSAPETIAERLLTYQPYELNGLPFGPRVCTDAAVLIKDLTRALVTCREKFVGYLHYDETGPVVAMIDATLAKARGEA